MTEYCLDQFKSITDMNHSIVSINEKTFMENIKNEFFDYKYSHWKVEKYKYFVITNKLSYLRCHEILKVFGSKYFKNIIKGKLGYEDFIFRIEKHNKLETGNKILIKTDRLDFYKDLYKLSKKHFSKIYEKDYFEFIDKNFETKTSKSHIKKLHRNNDIFEK